MHDVSFDARPIVRAATVLAALLVLATVVAEIGADLLPDNALLVGAREVVSLREEHNLGSFGATVLLLLCGGAALGVRWVTTDDSRLLWGVVGVGFTVLAADEMLIIHERFGRGTEAVLGDMAPSFAWLVPGVIVVVLLAIVLVPKLRRLPRRTWRGLLLAAVVFLVGALGLEALGSLLFEMEGAPDHLAGGLALVEEALEVAGTVIALWAITNHLQEQLLPVRVVSRPTPGEDR